MKKFGSKSGFTLVELIVVIAILGILAGIAVPAYSGYIKKANEAADYAQLDAIKTAVVFAYTDKHVNDDDFKDITSITVTKSGKGFAVAVVPQETDGKALKISDYYDLDNNTFKSDNDKAVWTASSAKWELSKTPTNPNPGGAGTQQPGGEGSET